MKNTRLILLGMASIVLTSPVWASSLIVPNTFVSGTPAKAADVNGNFSAVQAAVDDNNTRITANTTNKQNTVVGTCAAGSSIRVINSNGSVVCEVDDNSGGTITGVTAGAGLTGGGTLGSVTLKLTSGAVSVQAAQFRSGPATGCDLNWGYGYGYWNTTSTSTSCFAVAGVQLPEGATPTSLSCLQYDNDSTTATSYSNVWLVAQSNYSGTTYNLFQTPYTVDSTSLQKPTDTTLSGITGPVSNSNYSYFLEWYTSNHNATTVGMSVRLYNCSIGYTY